MRELRRQLWGYWIRWNQERHLLTQAEVADRIDEPDTHKIGRWARGEHIPGVRSRAALVALWGLPPWEPEAGLDSLPEFAAWIAEHAAHEARDHLLAVLKPPGFAAQEETAMAQPAVGGGALIPRQLPGGTAHFIGRTDELARLSAVLETISDDRPSMLLIVAIDGMGGIGKTELAIHWAHRVREHFPDGDLYVSLGGEDLNRPAVEPADALAEMLLALQVPRDRLPLELSGKVGLFRSLLAGKRLLIVLDNAASAAQVRPLLPGGGTCMVLVTSRNRLSALAVREGVHRVTLDLLSPEEALVLLRRVAGAGRVDAEPACAQAIARHCAHLPLALRIAADWMALYPRRPLSLLAEELADSSRRLGALTVWDGRPPQLQVQKVFSWSYLALSEGAKRAFRLLGLSTGPDISLPAAAALVNSDAATTEQWLAELSSVHLLEPTEPERYRMHDLLRAYARECVQAEETAAARAQAVTRMLHWYLHSADAAGFTLLPRRPRYPVGSAVTDHPPRGFLDAKEAFAWFEAEHENLIAAIHQAEEGRLWRIACDLAAVLWDHLIFQNRHWRHLILIEDIGLNAARQLGDEAGEAWMVGLRGVRLMDFNDDDQETAGACFDRLREFSQAAGPWPIACGHRLTLGEFGKRWMLGIALWGWGEIHCRRGQFVEALSHYEQGLVVLRSIGDKWMLGKILVGLARLQLNRGEDQGVREHLSEALALSRETGSRDGMVFSLQTLGNLYHRLGQRHVAIDCYAQAIGVCRDRKDTLYQANLLHKLGELYEEAGNPDSASQYRQQAALLFNTLG